MELKVVNQNHENSRFPISDFRFPTSGFQKIECHEFTEKTQIPISGFQILG